MRIPAEVGIDSGILFGSCPTMASESLSATCDSLTAHVAAMGDLLEENRRAVQAAKKNEQRSNKITTYWATQYVKAVALTVFALTAFLDPAPAAR